STSTLGALALATLAQDATTTLWIRERDVFGNMTSPAAQGVLSIHEDSQPPSAPHAFTEIISGLLTSEVGVLLGASREPGGGLVTYEILGGPYADYTAVATEPRIVLPGAASGSSTVYVIRGVDRADNPSSGVTVTVADTPLRALPNACVNCTYSDFHAGSGLATFTTQNFTTNQTQPACGSAPEVCRNHELNLCRRASADALECSSKIVYTNRSGNFMLQAPNMGGLVLAFADLSTQLSPVIKAMYVGADEALSTVDDGAIVTIGNGIVGSTCQTGTPTGVFFGNGSNANRLTFYNYGADRRPDIIDAGQGAVVVSAASSVFGFHPCKLQASARHVLWTDQRSGTRDYVFNLGNDGKPGGGDDGGEWLIPPGDNVLLGDDRILIDVGGGDWDIYDTGPDHVFGNGDDLPVVHLYDIPTLTAANGDKAFFTSFTSTADGMRDLTTGTTLPLTNAAFTGGDLGSVSASGTMIIGGLTYPGLQARPATYSVHGEPLTFQVADSSGEGGPSGTLAGRFYAFLDANERRPVFLNAEAGGFLRLEPNVTTLADMDVDDDGYFVWIDQPGGTVMIYYAGADGIPGTSDDKGPTQLAGPGTFHWPRVDAGVVVWGDLSLDPSGNWFDGNLDSRLKGVALGPDGWVGGGDDTPYDFTVAGTRAVSPDISLGNIVYADYADDPNDLCDGTRGSAPDTNCMPSIATFPIGGARTVIAAGGMSRADLRIEGNIVLYSELNGDWDVRMHTLGGATVSITASPTDERLPVLVGDSLAYYAEQPTPTLDGVLGIFGVFVVNRGPDLAFGTSDDIVRHRPANITPRACGDACANWDANVGWFD
ncbi:MAG TPA: hypothetical protein VLC93_10885, partial [Myxococcota bacterium]|nr:hypothetical protein [Myxococcota bacterium]